MVRMMITTPNPRAAGTRLRLVARDGNAMLLRVSSLLAYYEVRQLTLDADGDGWVRIELEVSSSSEDPRSSLLARRLGRVVGMVEVAQVVEE